MENKHKPTVWKAFLLSEPCSEAAGRRYLGDQTGSSVLWAATMLKEKQLHLRAGAGAGAAPTSSPIQPSAVICARDWQYLLQPAARLRASIRVSRLGISLGLRI